MNKTKRAIFGMALLLSVSAFALEAWSEEPVPLRVIPIPKKEHGYSNFETTVITSQNELDVFLERGSKDQHMEWNKRGDFEKALAQATLDFNRESLVLLRHTEGSGSVQINFRQPLVKDKRVICRIDRKEQGIGTGDMAYYCFALAVMKADIREVEIHVSGRSAVIVHVR